MKIKFIEIQNFRKLKSTHIDFDDETTILVGANNSGKTSAIVAISYFLSSSSNFTMRDVTIDNLSEINKLGEAWEHKNLADTQVDDQLLSRLLPKMDVWLDVSFEQIHQITHILPTLDWKGGLIGVRLQYNAKDLNTLRDDYLEERQRVNEVIEELKNVNNTSNAGSKKQQSINEVVPKLWPKNLSDFLTKRLSSHINLSSFPLDPDKIIKPRHNIAKLQTISDDAISFDGHPLDELIKVNQTNAQRGLEDSRVNNTKSSENFNSVGVSKKKLSGQLRSYYDSHLNPKSLPTGADVEALLAIQLAEESFDRSLKRGFNKPFLELEDLGYPGIVNPKIDISTEIKVKDSLNHGSAVQYNVGKEGTGMLLLPEDYVGLGFQNLISMVFDLMSYRDDWMHVGGSDDMLKNTKKIEPIHLVLVEEPEAHLHAQVQQVFVRKAYSLLRKHKELNNNKMLHTQLVISTHSSHIAYEVDFSCLRYFKRVGYKSKKNTPRTVVVNLSHLFKNPSEEQKFVAKYLKATHCDLFFADAVIFIEGQAEKLLLPEIIKSQFPNLNRRYYSLIEVGGSHAHKFQRIMEALGIATLVITDLDSVAPKKSKDRNGKEVTKYVAALPQKKSDQITANSVLKGWHPRITDMDKLLSLNDDRHEYSGCNGELYVAFQKEIQRDIDGKKLVPRTFEEALIFENSEELKDIIGNGTTAKVRKLVSEEMEDEDLASAIFTLVQSAAKGDFALDCLMLERESKSVALASPTYIAKGLKWLENHLEVNSCDINGGV
jgi:predicted ATP-dependent endonuclease of OLD family